MTDPFGGLMSKLAQLEAAERDGDWRRAMAVRTDIVASRLGDAFREPRVWRALDVAALDRLGADLQRLDLHEPALYLFAAAATLAEKLEDDGLWQTRVTCHGVLSSVALLNFDLASRALCRGLRHDGSLFDRSIADRIARLYPRGAADSEVGALRAEALYTVSRLRAGVGALQKAEETLRLALEILERPVEPWLRAPQVALFAAEVCLDQGALDRVDSLRDRWAREADPADRGPWLIIEATASTMRGRLSDASRQLLDALTLFASRSEAAAARVAQWHRVQVLMMLNRMDEAEDVLRILGADPAGRFDVSLMTQLLTARRTATLAVESAPRIALEAMPMHESAEGRLPRNGSMSDAPDLTRTRERARDDWARHANLVQLDLHDGHVDEAAERFAHLALWTDTLESPLLRARADYLDALLALNAGDPAAAERLARAAEAQFAELGLRSDEWCAARVRVWAQRDGDGAPAELSAAVMHADRLLREIRRQLSPEDRALYLLNKWSTVDGAIAERCRETIEAPPSRQRWWNRHWPYEPVRRVLEDVLALKRWELADRVEHDTLISEEAREGPADLFTRAREQTRHRRRAPGLGIELGGLRRRWMPRDCALLHHVVLPNRVHTFMLHRNRCELLATAAVTRADLHNTVIRAVRALAAGTEWAGLTSELEPLAGMLGLPQLEQRLPAGTTRLAVVPDDVVVHAPFAALPFRGRPLVMTLSATVLPDVRWLAYAGDDVVRMAHALGVGVPASPKVPVLAHLPDPSHELALIGNAAARPHILRDSAATRQAVLAALPTATAGHFACHGEFRADDPHASGLLMWDGWLTLRDIRTITMPRLDLLVMGACWTANASVLPGREIISLPTTVLDRGAKSVVSTLWELFDEPVHGPGVSPTLEFMQELYKTLAHAPPREALARVQRAWALSRPTSDWAGYQVYEAGLTPPPYVRATLILVDQIRRLVERGVRDVKRIIFSHNHVLTSAPSRMGRQIPYRPATSDHHRT